MKFKFLLLTSIFISSIWLSGCGNNHSVENTLNNFGEKVNELQEFTGETEVDFSVINQDGEEMENLKHNEDMDIKADFNEKEMHLKVNGSKDNEKLATDIYIKDGIMYFNPFGNWMIYPVLDNEFGESLKIKNLPSIYSELKQIESELSYSKTNDLITLEVDDLKEFKLSQETLNAMFGPLSGLDDAKVISYSISIVLDSKSFLPTKVNRKLTILIDNNTYIYDTNIKYHSFDNVDVTVPEAAMKAKFYE